MKCGTFYDVHTIKDSYGIPICSCGGMIKPDVVLYEEALDEMVIKQSISQIQQADLLIVGELLWRFILQQVLYNIFVESAWS